MRKLTLTSLVFIGLLIGTSHADESLEAGSARFEAELGAKTERQLSDFVNVQLDGMFAVIERREAYAMRHPATPDPSPSKGVFFLPLAGRDRRRHRRPLVRKNRRYERVDAAPPE